MSDNEEKSLLDGDGDGAFVFILVAVGGAFGWGAMEFAAYLVEHIGFSWV